MDDYLKCCGIIKTKIIILTNTLQFNHFTLSLIFDFLNINYFVHSFFSLDF